MAVTFHGYLFRELNWIERTLFLAGGLALVYPHTFSTLLGCVLVGLLIAKQLLTLRSQKSMA